MFALEVREHNLYREQRKEDIPNVTKKEQSAY